MNYIKDFAVVGSSRRCLILKIGNRHVFCSTGNYAYLCTNPEAKWDIVDREEHNSTTAHPVTGEPVARHFNSTAWVVVYKPHFL